MIIHRYWVTVRSWRVGLDAKAKKLMTREGWFLFGLLPLYIRDTPQ